MKNVLINRNLLFICALFLIVISCKKADEITPSFLTGKWEQNGIAGKVTYTDSGKSTTEDLSEAANKSLLEFNADGLTVNYLGANLNYKISGSIITFSGTNGISFEETIAKSSATQLTLSFTKDQFFKLLDIVYANKKTDPDYVEFLKIKSTITSFQYDESYIKK
jgi:hypothetical protein